MINNQKNKGKKKENRDFWKYLSVISILIVVGVFGIQFMNQSETKELPINNNQKIVIKEELKPEKVPVFHDSEKKRKMNVSSTFVKKKISKSKPNKDNFLAEKTTVVEDILLYESTKVASKVSSKYVYYNTGYQGQVPGLRIVTGSENHPEKNRNPETILKDVVALTRNGNYTYIVDGVRVSEETFRSLNQNDVESVDIYKHTDAYNARFGNKENQSRIVLKSK